MFVLGAIAGFLLLQFLAKRDSVFHSQDVSILFMGCYVGGYFGARLFSIFVDQDVSLGELVPQIFSLGPMTFYGGAIGSTVVGLVLAMWKRWPLRELTDCAFPAGLLGLAIGRVGCFLNGDDYGRPTEIQGAYAPWYSVRFPNLEDHIDRVPVQLISTIVVGTLVAVLVWNFDKIRARFGVGSIGLLSVSSYAVFRIFAEMLRGDARGSIFNGMLSTSQFVSILVLIVCGCWASLLRQYKQVKK
jgi:phosphatidylglycerol:prolipoprotein diacylglycerol transferase